MDNLSEECGRKVRIVLADDHRIVRSGLRALLSYEPDFEVIGEARNGQEAAEMARTLGIDGPLLREFGLAGLMHDIGKVRTPKDILNKPDKLTKTKARVSFNVSERI